MTVIRKGELLLPTVWETMTDPITQGQFMENTKNFWLDRDIPFNKDVHVWKTDMSPEEQETFCKALAGLTLLDTHQGADGMTLIGLHEDDGQVKALLSWFGTMEHIHAKFYSKTFQSLISTEKIKYYTEEWIQSQTNLQLKAKFIVDHYRKLFCIDASHVDRWKAKACSTMLESGLFYSGFYFPLMLAGGWGGSSPKARMVDTNDGINLIIRDESLHGSYIGWSAERDFNEWFNEAEKEELTKWFYESMDFLYENEVAYTHELYDKVGLTEDALKFVRYNFNRVCVQLGLDEIFDEEEINPIVETALSVSTKNHDFFSRINNSYFKANVTTVTNSTFKFNREPAVMLVKR